MVDRKGNITSYAYNAAGNLTTMTPPAPLGVRTFTFDTAGRKTSEADGRGHTSFSCYDKDDRVTQVSYKSSNCAVPSGVTYTHDTAGNTTGRVDNLRHYHLRGMRSAHPGADFPVPGGG